MYFITNSDPKVKYAELQDLLSFHHLCSMDIIFHVAYITQNIIQNRFFASRAKHNMSCNINKTSFRTRRRHSAIYIPMVRSENPPFFFSGLMPWQVKSWFFFHLDWRFSRFLLFFFILADTVSSNIHQSTCHHGDGPSGTTRATGIWQRGHIGIWLRK